MSKRSLARFIQVPVWAHAEYETTNEGVLRLYDSLEKGDIIRVNGMKLPLEVSAVRSDSINVQRPGGLEPITYTLQPGDGRKYQLYLHRENSKEGISKLAVIYRADGRISKYTSAEIAELVESHQIWSARWDTATTTIEPADLPPGTTMPDVPTVTPTREETMDDADDRPRLFQFDNPARLAAAKAMAAVRFEGKSVDDFDNLTRSVEFETKERYVTGLQAPHDHAPAGTVFFVDPNADRRCTVLLDKIKRLVGVSVEEATTD